MASSGQFVQGGHGGSETPPLSPKGYSVPHTQQDSQEGLIFQNRLKSLTTFPAALNSSSSSVRDQSMGEGNGEASALGLAGLSQEVPPTDSLWDC